MNKPIRQVALWTFLFTALACGSNPLELSGDQNAVVSEPSEESRTLIADAIALLLNGARVEIAKDAFAADSYIVVHRSMLIGEDMGSVHRFRLVANTGSCFLILENTGGRREIDGLGCEAKETD